MITPPDLNPRGPWALAGGRWFWGTPQLSNDPSVLDREGCWVVCLPTTGGLHTGGTVVGEMVAARFPHSSLLKNPPADKTQRVVPETSVGISSQRTSAVPESARWRSSLSPADYAEQVDDIRERIADGDVYQVNLTRRLAGPTRHDHPGTSALALTTLLAEAHRAPHGATLCLPEVGVWVVGASPERFLSRDGLRVTSEPIKGTATSPELLTDKDRAENVMICDLVRNDLGRVCRPGTVEVPHLLRVESHPTLVHLVTTVTGQLRPEVGWSELLDATFPPGSVTGAPKLAALSAIEALETEGRGPYCGALGWVDADARTADLAVSIRTFWAAGSQREPDRAPEEPSDSLVGATTETATHAESPPPAWHWTFGTGGAITWDSDAADEWAETELKAARLLQLAEAPLGATGMRLSPRDPAPRVW